MAGEQLILPTLEELAPVIAEAAPAAAEAAGSVGSRFSQILSKIPGVSKLPFLSQPVLTKASKGRTLLGIAAGLGALGLGKSFVDTLRGEKGPTPVSYDPNTPTYIQTILSAPTQEQRLRDLYAQPAFATTIPSTDYAAQAAAANAAAMKNLNDYLAQLQKTGAQSGKAIAEAYQKAAKETAALGTAQAAQGQDVAATIDRLYQNLGLSSAQLAAGGGVSGEPTQLTGLAPTGGEAATAQQTVPTYGASLADYLGREAAIGGKALEQQALSQAEQGAGMASNLQNMIALASAQQRYAAQQAAAERMARAQQADVEAARQAKLMQMQMEQDRAQRLFEAQQADTAARQALYAQTVQARAQAEQIWNNATGPLKKSLENKYGSGDAGRLMFMAAARENPTIISGILQG